MFNFIVRFLQSFFSILFSKKKDLLCTILLLKKENEILKRHLKVQNKKMIFTRNDRLSFAFIKALSERALHHLTVVKPETLLKWQKQFIKNLWTYKSRKRGRPYISISIKELILERKQEKYLWGCRRIADELQKLHISVHYSTVNRILQTYRKNGKLQPNGSWKKVLTSHWHSLHAVDFMTIYTLFGKRLYLLLIIQLKTRKIVRWQLTEYPSREFVRQQIIEFTYDLPETITLIHDNGSQFTSIDFTQYNIQAVNTSVASPNMNVYVERLIGSVRRKALDHFLLFSEKQVTRIISEYVNYFNTLRPHQGIHSIPECGNNSPIGKIQKKSVLWDLHHHYYRSSA